MTNCIIIVTLEECILNLGCDIFCGTVLDFSWLDCDKLRDNFRIMVVNSEACAGVELGKIIFPHIQSSPISFLLSFFLSFFLLFISFPLSSCIHILFILFVYHLIIPLSVYFLLFSIKEYA
jgi:hypothetical protein